MSQHVQAQHEAISKCWTLTADVYTLWALQKQQTHQSLKDAIFVNPASLDCRGGGVKKINFITLKLPIATIP